MKNAPVGELFDKEVKESEEAIMMSEVNEKLNPVELSPLKKYYN